MATSSPPPALASDTVLTFLESIGQRAEAEFYLKLFREVPKESFGLVAVDNPVVRYALGSFVEHLRFLADLGLYAPVVLGLFGTGASDTISKRFIQRLPAAGLTEALYRSRDPELVERIRADLRAEKVPIVWFDRAERIPQAERLAQVADLLRQLDSQKLVYLRRSGGLRPQATSGHRSEQALDLNNGTISVLNLRTDSDYLLGGSRLTPDDEKLLKATRELLLQASRPRLMVNIASPLNLLKELFTAKGAGTLVKQGTLIQRYRGYATMDLVRLKALIEHSFGRQLREGFFEQPPLAAYVEADYRGAAIVTDSPVGPYLSKFAVEPRARGEGLGQDVWQCVVQDFPMLVWRARPENPIAAWYNRVCSGMVRAEKWNVYWRGLAPRELPGAIEHVLERPSDFAE